MTKPNEPHSCVADCVGRRAFLLDSVRFAAAIAGASALAPLSSAAAANARAAKHTVRYAIPTVDGASIDSKNEVILCRSNGEVFAFALSCPHQNTAIRALSPTKGFQCPRHKSRYQPDGTFINGKATRNMDRLPITREGNELVVDVDVAFESDTEPMKWASAVVKL